MRKLSFITAIAALLIVHQTTRSQTMTANEKQLESAVKKYNELNTFIDQFGGENKMALSDLYAIDADVDRGVALLDDLIKKESGEIVRTANYFRTNFLYQQAFAYGIHGNNVAAYTKFKAIANEINALTSSSFPFRYKFEEKNYIINWENFSLTLGEFYAAMAELGGINSDDEESLKYARLSIDFPQSTEWYKLVSLSQILKIKENKQQYDQEIVDISLRYMNHFAGLSEESKEAVDTYDFPDYSYAWNLLATAVQRNPALSNNGYYYAQATSVFKKMADDRSLSDAYMKAVNAGYSDRAFLFEAADYAVPKKFRALATPTLNKLYLSKNEQSCAELQRLADLNNAYGESARARELSESAADCLKKQARLEKKAAKSSSSSGSSRPSGTGGFHLYLGTYPIKFFGPNDRRDYGGVLGLLFRKAMLEFSYVKIQQNRDHMQDLYLRGIETDISENGIDFEPRWDGYNAQFAIKFTSNNSAGENYRFYVGPQFGYSYRQIDSMNVVAVTNNVTGTTTNATFAPVDKHYEAILTFGSLAYGKVLGLDLGFGIGGYYSQFDIGNDAINNTDFTINNVMLANRKKSHFGPLLRLSLTIGFML